MKEGFLIGGGLIVAGLMLELSVGPVAWDAFRWPVNGIVLAVFLTLIAIAFQLRKKVYGFQFIGTYKAAIPALVYAVLLTVIMGLIPQMNLASGSSTMSEDGMWLNHIISFWPFVLIYVYVTVILGLTVLRQLKAWAVAKFSIFNFQFSILFHLGLFIALTTATLGNADMQRLKMITIKGEPEWRALNEQKQVVEMPLAIELKNFIMETYDDGKPKRYASEVQILTQTRKSIHAIIDVNKPVKVEGWKIYQYGYDTQMGKMSQMSILELIRDPWLPLVYSGIYMMLAGAVLMMLSVIPWKRGAQQVRKHPKAALLLCALIAACFFCVHHFMPILHSDTLVPALQSPWFKPHIVAYMLAYTLMAAAAVMALYVLIRGGKCGHDSSSHLQPPAYVDNIVYIGLSLITIGMLFGALWAKEAWGHYWSWDPKETWAAITWFSYLVYVHYRKMPTRGNSHEAQSRLALWVLLISFALLQMCWWGINYLPSAKASSVHVYGQP